MAKLTCEVCGGSLNSIGGGMFECEFCGMKYDKTRVQQMIQEIKGTVKVEGSVEVTGTVKVAGVATSDTLTQKAFADLEMEENRIVRANADELFRRALESDPNNGDALLGIAMIQAECHYRDKFWEGVKNGSLQTYNYFERLRKCTGGSRQLRQELADYENWLAAEQQRKKKQASEGQNKAKGYETLRKKYARAQGLVPTGGGMLLRSDGTCLTKDCPLDLKNKDWHDIVAIDYRQYLYSTHLLAGIRADGAVLVFCGNSLVYTAFQPDREIRAILVSGDNDGHASVAGISKRGQVFTAHYGGYERSLREWCRELTDRNDLKRVFRLGGTFAAVDREGEFVGVSESWKAPEDIVCGVTLKDWDRDKGVMLKSDGTLTYPEGWYQGKLGAKLKAMTQWTDVIAIAYEKPWFVALLANGKVRAECLEEDEPEKQVRAVKETVKGLKDIVAINGACAVDKDGFVHVINREYACFDGKRLFTSLKGLEQDHLHLKEHMESAWLEKKKALQVELEAAQRELDEALKEYNSLGKLAALTGKKAKVEARVSAAAARRDTLQGELERM